MWRFGRLGAPPEVLSRRAVWVLTLLLGVLAGLPRLYFLSQSAHPDPLLWIDATKSFSHALAERHLEKTLQYSHPGVVAMWISAAAMKLHGLTDVPITPQTLIDIKLPGAILGTLMAALTFPLLLSVPSVGQKRWIPVLALAGFLATEPFLVEQSRIGELDIPSLALVWLGFWLLVRAFDRNSRSDAAWAGVLFGLGVVTKVAIGPVPAVAALGLVGHTVYARFRDLRGLKLASIATVCAVAAVFVVWPALWVAPIKTLKFLVTDVTSMANIGHHHVIDGVSTTDPGIGFYAKYLQVTIPPETALLAAFGFAALWWTKGLRSRYGWLTLSLLVSLLAVALAPKKLQRYVVAVAPILCLFSSALAAWVVERNPLKLRQAGFWVLAALGLFVVGRAARLGAEMPYAQHCNEWVDSETCSRPSSMYFFRDLAKAIRRDWGDRAALAKPFVFMNKVELMEPWCKARPAHTFKKADYVVVWDDKDPTLSNGSIKEAVLGRLHTLRHPLATVRYHERTVARLYRLYE